MGAGFLAAWALSACAPRYLIYSPEKFAPLGIKAALGEFSIQDERPDQKAIHIAFFESSKPSIFPSPLDSAHTTAIREQLTRNLEGGARTFTFRINLQKAEAGYQAGFMRREESAQAKLKMEVFESGRKLSECNGSAELQRKSQKASEKMLKRMFRESLVLAIYKCLEAVKPELQKTGPRNGEKI